MDIEGCFPSRAGRPAFLMIIGAFFLLILSRQEIRNVLLEIVGNCVAVAGARNFMILIHKYKHNTAGVSISDATLSLTVSTSGILTDSAASFACLSASPERNVPACFATRSVAGRSRFRRAPRSPILRSPFRGPPRISGVSASLRHSAFVPGPRSQPPCGSRRRYSRLRNTPSRPVRPCGVHCLDIPCRFP